MKWLTMILKHQPLCSGKSNLGDRISSEVEKNSFIALPLRNCVPTWEDLVMNFISLVQRWAC